MCLLFVAIDSHPRYRFFLAANRDEFYNRPTRSAHFWKEHPHLLAGRDLKQGGTWCGITKSGRWAALTNFREMSRESSTAPSRGSLVVDFLTSNEAPKMFLDRLQNTSSEYNGFSLLFGNDKSIIYYSNRDLGARELTRGIYGLSNHLLDTPWPKVNFGKEQISRLDDPTPDALFNILANQNKAIDEELPNTGVSLEWERLLSTSFIESPEYGTRCSTIVSIDYNNRINFEEREFDKTGEQHSPERYIASGYEFDIIPNFRSE